MTNNTQKDYGGRVIVIISFIPLIKSVIHEMEIPYTFNDFNLDCFNELYECLLNHDEMVSGIRRDVIEEQQSMTNNSNINVIIDYVKDKDGNIIYSDEIAQIVFIPSNIELYDKLKTIITKNTDKVVLCNPIIQ